MGPGVPGPGFLLWGGVQVGGRFRTPTPPHPTPPHPRGAQLLKQTLPGPHPPGPLGSPGTRSWRELPGRRCGGWGIACPAPSGAQASRALWGLGSEGGGSPKRH